VVTNLHVVLGSTDVRAHLVGQPGLAALHDSGVDDLHRLSFTMTRRHIGVTPYLETGHDILWPSRPSV
jgi:tetrahydromethanopterin S-methyltransferase subunit A